MRTGFFSNWETKRNIPNHRTEQVTKFKKCHKRGTNVEAQVTAHSRKKIFNILKVYRNISNKKLKYIATVYFYIITVSLSLPRLVRKHTVQCKETIRLLSAYPGRRGAGKKSATHGISFRKNSAE
jgi:hypothetical protein